MEIYQVSFIGHRVVDEHRQVADELDTVLSMLLEKHEYIEFYVGKNGEFDELAASAVRRLKSEWSAFCSLTLVLPYEIANLDLIEKSYDEVIMPNDYKCHYKAAIEKRNRWLAENCDLMIGYIKREIAAHISVLVTQESVAYCLLILLNRLNQGIDYSVTLCQTQEFMLRRFSVLKRYESFRENI